jgi:hypothetical protein
MSFKAKDFANYEEFVNKIVRVCNMVRINQRPLEKIAQDNKDVFSSANNLIITEFVVGSGCTLQILANAAYPNRLILDIFSI